MYTARSFQDRGKEERKEEWGKGQGRGRVTFRHRLSYEVRLIIGEPLDEMVGIEEDL